MSQTLVVPLAMNEIYSLCPQVLEWEPVCYSFYFFSIIFNLYNLFDKVISVLFSFKVLIAFECNNTITSHNWGKWGFDYILTVTIVEEFGN